MIGWKVDIGYVNPNANDFSSTVFSDIDRVWGFNIAPLDYGFFGEKIPNGYNGEVVGYEEIINDIYGYGEKLLGLEVNMLYGYRWPGAFVSEPNSIDYLNRLFRTQITSLNDMYPNMWTEEYITSPPGRITIYFKTLNKVAVFSSGSFGTVEIYQLVENKLINILSVRTVESFRPVVAAGSIGVTFGGIALHKYDKPEDLIDYTNYRMIHIDYGDKYTGGASKTSANIYVVGNQPENGIFHRFFKALLGTNPSVPDVIVLPGDTENPYPVDPSGPGDLPPGTFDDTSDPIPLPSTPTLSAANTGFTRIYNPTLSQVQALARYLWTDETVIQTIWNHIKQYFEDPMQAIIGFNLVPVPVPDGGTQNFALMYIDTGVSMTVAANQFVDVDCGSVELERYYGSALDQSPYTKVHCFLPYIGMVQLDTDEVMGTVLSVNYRVDIVTGSCVASVLVDGNVLYQYSGHCAINIPISSADYSSYVSAAISVAKLGVTVGTAMATGGGSIALAGAAQETGQMATTTIETVNTVRNPATGRQITDSTTTQTITAPTQQAKASTSASLGGLTPRNISNTVGQIMGSKPNIQHSGSFSGNSGYLGVRRPYLIIERPNMCLPETYQKLNGYPSMISLKLGNCTGYTRVQQVQLTGMGYATNPEQAEILELLKAGVIL